MQKKEGKSKKTPKKSSTQMIPDGILSAIENVQKTLENLSSFGINSGVIDNEFDTLSDEVNSFLDTNTKSLNSIDDWNNLFDGYQLLTEKVKKYSEKCKQDQVAFENCSKLISKMSVAYELQIRDFNIWQIKNYKSLESKIDKQQASTFTVFSIFMTLLTFILTNVTLGKTLDFDFNKFLVVNLLLILVATVLFAFLGIFLGVIGKTGSKKLIVFKYFILFILPLIALAAFLVVFCALGV